MGPQPQYPDCKNLDIKGPYYTWRGTTSLYGKAMRLDYAIVSSSILSLVQSVEIFGKGFDLKGFLGSDHCPVKITLLNS